MTGGGVITLFATCCEAWLCLAVNGPRNWAVPSFRFEKKRGKSLGGMQAEPTKHEVTLRQGKAMPHNSWQSLQAPKLTL